MNDTIEAIKERIRKLRKMTPDNGCTEAEAMAAAEKVRKLLAEYELSEESADFATESVPLDRRRRTPMDGLWGVIAAYCDCMCFLSPGPDRRLSVNYYGRHPKPLLAEYLHDICQGALIFALDQEKRSPEYLRRRTRGTRSRHLKAFQEGFIRALSFKLARMKGGWKAAEIEAAKASFERDGGQLRNLPQIQSAGGRYKNSFVKGAMEGERVDLNDGVREGGAVRRIGSAA